MGREPEGTRVLGQTKTVLFGTCNGDNWLPTWEKNDESLPYFLYQNKFQMN